MPNLYKQKTYGGKIGQTATNGGSTTPPPNEPANKARRDPTAVNGSREISLGAGIGEGYQ